MSKLCIQYNEDMQESHLELCLLKGIRSIHRGLIEVGRLSKILTNLLFLPFRYDLSFPAQSFALRHRRPKQGFVRLKIKAPPQNV